MPYYHVYICFRDRRGKERKIFSYDWGGDPLKKKVAIPYMKNIAFLISGIVIHPSNIDEIHIYESEKKFQELTLPNRKSPFDEGVTNPYIAKCFDHEFVKGVSDCTYVFITSPPEEKEELKTPELTIGLMKSATFLGLDNNWSLATCALQLQEVAMTVVAKRKNIELDKANVEKVLNKRIEKLSFNNQYEAFSRLVKVSFNIEMPILTTDLRRMRTRVLHKGYNPKPEETESIVSFTIGLLKKLKDIS